MVLLEVDEVVGVEEEVVLGSQFEETRVGRVGVDRAGKECPPVNGSVLNDSPPRLGGYSKYTVKNRAYPVPGRRVKAM